MDYQQIRDIIANARKKTPVTVHVRHDGELETPESDALKVFPTGAGTTILVGEWDVVAPVLESPNVAYHHLDNDRRNSAIPLLDLKPVNARIEPGCIIREGAEIGDNVIGMMGAVVNIGAVVGDGTMLDMNCVVGARAMVGRNCHIGAGAVLAGVLEPPSATPVVIEDDVLVGANAVVLEGIRVGAGSVVAAGAVVNRDVPPLSVAAGQPARVIKEVDERTKDKTGLLKELRRLNE
ncbi:MAG: 2,3,4,5-tetrahydropyridine-2,6-dicarboxylate N-acetyltransferase [Longimicrobiales bacterium]|nr:2,3,4,5-tetrahydropyridine-2,6-dicarboxylate N-acetyltransferase [Longimicrobiales bacterium]